MAIIKPSAIVDAISGNLGGVNFATGKGGPYVRNRLRRSGQRSTREIETRAYMQIARHQWQDMDAPTKTSWIQAAANRPYTNRLGVTSHLSGHQLYIQMAMLGVGAPIEFNFGPGAQIPFFAAPQPLVFVSMTVESGGSKIIRFDEPQPDNNRNAIIYGARTFSSATRRSWYNFTLLYNNPLTPGVPFLRNLTDAWDEAIGDPQPGEQVWWKFIYGGTATWPSAPGLASGFAT